MTFPHESKNFKTPYKNIWTYTMISKLSNIVPFLGETVLEILLENIFKLHFPKKLIYFDEKIQNF